MDVSVIIVNYNTCRMTADCIESVRQKTSGISYEIILVDNGSTDGSKEYFEQFEGIKYIYSEENLGFGRANNLGAKQASGDYLFLLNSDTLLINNAIKILHDYISTHPKAGMVGGNLFDKNGKPTLSFKRFLPGLKDSINELSFCYIEKLFFGKNRYFNQSDIPLAVGYIMGADIMIRKKIFDELNGFSNDFFMYYEETDLCKRIKDAGCARVCVPSAHITHLEGYSFLQSDKTSILRFKMLEESRNIYFLKNSNKFTKFICDRLDYFTIWIKSKILKNGRVRNYYKSQLDALKSRNDLPRL